MVPIDHFDTAAEIYRDRTAVVDGAVSLTYGTLQRLSIQAAALLSGLSSGDQAIPVAICSPNDYRVLAAMLGVMRAGGAIVPLHAGNHLDATIRFLRQVEPRALFCHGTLAREAESLQAAVASIVRRICLDEVAVDAAAEPLPDTDATSWIDAAGNPGRPVFIWATSGSTGDPKVVINDVESFDGAHRAMRAVLAQKDGPHVSLVVAPLSHTAGPYAFTLLTLGATIVILRQFDAGEVLANIQRHRVTHLWLPPTALYLLLSHPDVKRYDLSSLRDLHLGAAAVSPDRLKEAIEVFGPCLSQTYGQIEGGPLTLLDSETTAAALAGDHPERLQSSGRSLFISRIAIMSEERRLLPSPEVGEIVVRGRCVKPYKDALDTAEARRGGWHHTGDLGYFDADGFLYVVGRTKDVINRAGFKIAAAEVERVIMELPQVHECAVVASPDAVRGEVVKAVVVARSGHVLQTENVTAHCRRRLGVIKAPSHVELWPELPKSAVGKIDKARIRALGALSPELQGELP